MSMTRRLMAKVFENTDPSHAFGWYYMLEMRPPIGPYPTRNEAVDALRSEARVLYGWKAEDEEI
jgi:hypothetical protein